MKQLLIVNSAKALNAGISSGKDISSLQEGAITFLDPNTDAILAAKPTANFAIALGRANGQLPFMISEVDINSLKVTKASPVASTAMVETVTVTNTTKEVGFMIVKKGAVPHERNTITFSIIGTGTAATDAASLVAEFTKRNKVMALPFTVTNTGAVITVTCTKTGDLYTVVGIGAVTVVETTAAKPATGDKAYVEQLASMCAAGKGFNDTDAQGREFLPGYPENVEDTTYTIYTLRFAVPRVSAKTRDEVVNQLVHIAVPTTGSGASARTTAIETILGLIAPTNP